MKNKRVTILLIITNIILIAILYSFIRINGSIIKEKQIIKEMSESTQVTDLNNQINALNTEHIEYMNYIQTCKAQLANAITDMGVETSENISIDTMVINIRSISGTSSGDDVVYVDGARSNGVAASSGSSINKTYTATKKCRILVVGGTQSYNHAYGLTSITSTGLTVSEHSTINGISMAIYDLQEGDTITAIGSGEWVTTTFVSYFEIT